MATSNAIGTGRKADTRATSNDADHGDATGQRLLGKKFDGKGPEHSRKNHQGEGDAKDGPEALWHKTARSLDELAPGFVRQEFHREVERPFRLALLR